MKFVLAWVLLMFALPSWAQLAVVGQRGEKVPSMKVADVVMKADESEAEFLQRTGIWLRNFTTSSGYEACSKVCRSPTGQMGFRISTSNSHVGCVVVDQNACPDNMSPVGDSMHSHPVANQVEMNANDRILLMVRGNSMKKSQSRLFNNHHPDEFSKEDYASGPGYLVTKSKIWYQNGMGTQKLVLELPPLEGEE